MYPPKDREEKKPIYLLLSTPLVEVNTDSEEELDEIEIGLDELEIGFNDFREEKSVPEAW